MKRLITIGFVLALLAGCLSPDSKKEDAAFEDPPMTEETIEPDMETGGGDEAPEATDDSI